MKTIKLTIVALLLSSTLFVFGGNTDKATEVSKHVVITEKALFLDGTLFLEFNSSIDADGTIFYYCPPTYKNIMMVAKTEKQVIVFFEDGERMTLNL